MEVDEGKARKLILLFTNEVAMSIASQFMKADVRSTEIRFFRYDVSGKETTLLSKGEIERCFYIGLPQIPLSLQSKSSLLFQNIRMHVPSIREALLIRGYEKRKNNVLYLYFVHGRSARFEEFKRKVRFATTDICDYCHDETDSVEHL